MTIWGADRVPSSRDPVSCRLGLLIDILAGRALAADLEVDPPLGRVELYALYDPWQMQTYTGQTAWQ